MKPKTLTLVSGLFFALANLNSISCQADSGLALPPQPPLERTVASALSVSKPVAPEPEPKKPVKGLVIFGELEVVDRFYNQNRPLSELVRDYLAQHQPSSLERKIIVNKAERLLQVYLNNTLLKEYGVSLGFSPVGDKFIEGDGRTPEGEYYVAAKNPHSRYYLALLFNYPNPDDAQQGLASGLINPRQYQAIIKANENCETPPQNTALGSFLELHGWGGGPGQPDWTAGCIALDDEAIKELYAFSTLCETKIIINP